VRAGGVCRAYKLQPQACRRRINFTLTVVRQASYSLTELHVDVDVWIMLHTSLIRIQSQATPLQDLSD
jgi:hypothetical protein